MEGAYPVTSKERDSITIEDMLFPKATVNRLARAIIPEGGILSKDSATAVQRSSTVFVSYLLVQYVSQYISESLESLKSVLTLPTVPDSTLRSTTERPLVLRMFSLPLNKWSSHLSFHP